jgi:DNA-binding transcriptional LysR family regulator
MALLDWYIRANLKPKHMQLLVGLDDLRNVGRVAGLLNVSQPAVSKTLAEIERGLGVSLFERGPRGLTPTSYGECMIRLCRDMLRSLDSAGDELRQLQSGTTGRVRVGVLPVAAPVLAPRAAIRLQQKAPRSIVIFHEATADRLLPMLREGSLDIVVGTLAPLSMSGLEVHVLHSGEGSAAVCGLRHPLAARTTLVPADLLPYSLIIPPRGTIYRDAVEQVMTALELPISMVQVESGSMTASNTYLRETQLVSFYSPHLAKHYACLGSLHVMPLAIPDIRVPIGCVWPKNPELGPTTRLLIDMLIEVAAEELSDDPT